MSHSPQTYWGNNPNAPNIPSQLYPYEKAKLVGVISCAIFYGFVVVLFFQCIGALVDPISRAQGGLRHLLVVHTVAMFLFGTIYTATNLNILSAGYIDNRRFSGVEELPPGPLGYQYLAYTKLIGIISTVTFLLNNWLADGLLLYRCYIIYAMNPWAISFPCLIYLGTFATGILLVYYQISHPSCTIWRSSAFNVGIPYSISVSLNVLITLMIAARLVLLSRDLQKAMNVPFKLSGLYKAVVAVLSESSALYAITFLLFIGTWAANNPAEYFFWPMLAQTQVIAPFLIVLRVANRREFVSEVESGDIGPIRIARGVCPDSDETSHTGYFSNSDTRGKVPEGIGISVVTTVDSHHDET